MKANAEGTRAKNRSLIWSSRQLSVSKISPGSFEEPTCFFFLDRWTSSETVNETLRLVESAMAQIVSWGGRLRCKWFLHIIYKLPLYLSYLQAGTQRQPRGGVKSDFCLQGHLHIRSIADTSPDSPLRLLQQEDWSETAYTKHPTIH